MQSVEYGVGRYLDEPYEVALPRVVEALKTEGFGVITEIDVKKTMKDKLGIDAARSHPRRLQPAAGPRGARRRARARPAAALQRDRLRDDGGTRVTAINPGAMLGMIGNDRPRAHRGRGPARLDRVLQSL